MANIKKLYSDIVSNLESKGLLEGHNDSKLAFWFYDSNKAYNFYGSWLNNLPENIDLSMDNDNVIRLVEI